MFVRRGITDILNQIPGPWRNCSRRSFILSRLVRERHPVYSSISSILTRRGFGLVRLFHTPCSNSSSFRLVVTVRATWSYSLVTIAKWYSNTMFCTFSISSSSNGVAVRSSMTCFLDSKYSNRLKYSSTNSLAPSSRCARAQCPTRQWQLHARCREHNHHAHVLS